MFDHLWKAASDKAASIVGTVADPVRRIAAIPEQIREQKAAEERERKAAEERGRLEREAAQERARAARLAAEKRALLEQIARREVRMRFLFYSTLGLIGLGACSVLAIVFIGMMTDRPAAPGLAEPPAAAQASEPKAAPEPAAAAPEPAPIAPPAPAPIAPAAIVPQQSATEPAPVAAPALPASPPAVAVAEPGPMPAPSAEQGSAPPVQRKQPSGFRPGFFDDTDNNPSSALSFVK